MTERDLWATLDDGFFERSQVDYAGGAVRHLRRVGSRVEAEVWGGGLRFRHNCSRRQDQRFELNHSETKLLMSPHRPYRSHLVRVFTPAPRFPSRGGPED